ncbi:hypothetical protein [Arthrobacter pigmenti]
MGILALQLVVPAIAFFQEPPTRLGWQMYSGIGELPKVHVETEANTTEKIVFMDVAANNRSEIDWRKYLPEFVCQENANAIAVELAYSTRTESFECGK